MTRSLRNRAWNLPEIDPQHLLQLGDLDIDPHVAGIMSARGIAPEGALEFLSPSLRDALPDPHVFIDMQKAGARIVQAINDGSNIAIWSDYDVDGAASGALLSTYLTEIGHPAMAVHIPDRVTEGYGPNTSGLLALRERGAELVVILDSGTAAIEPLTAAHEAGLDVVVIDHHIQGGDLPPACAVVNPNRRDQPEGFGHVCAAGMTFFALIEINRQLRSQGFFETSEAGAPSEPRMANYLDLAALATVCDVVPLHGVNRALVATGLKVLSARARPGIAALAWVAGCKPQITARDCGFGLGPRINAAGRIGQPDLGLQLLCETDHERAREIADQLQDLNTERQSLERAATAEAIGQLEGRFEPGQTRAIALAVVDAHEGIVGISAARVKEAFDVPTFVLAPTEEGLLKGSGRSVPGFDLGSAVVAAAKEGILVKGGGHAMAAGITLEPENLPRFEAFVNARIEESDYARDGVVTQVDARIGFAEADVGFIEHLEQLAPFGQGNPLPAIALADVHLEEVRILKEKHLKLILRDPAEQGRARMIDAVIWNAVGTPLGDALIEAQGKIVDVLGSLEINEWNGRKRVQMMLDDLRLT